ncbi:hypothetical protein WJX84_011268 [Apatococcus fuscideae]|uniref:Ran guanine nucleotide release factor n=1 Tax=Apatococcus fuscideae TaxID=2026836 RepID=A0AAW1RGB5_9CHLO
MVSGVRKLFGGAIESAFPARLEDVSCLRPVPDSQEMFTDAELDQTLIVEIMEHQQLPPRKAAETFFADMADLDGAVTSTVDIIDDQGRDHCPLIPAGLQQTLLQGSVVVKEKGLSVDGNKVLQVSMANIRIPEKQSDILVTFLRPRHGSSVAHLHAAESVHTQALATFQIHDWALFG